MYYCHSFSVHGWCYADIRKARSNVSSEGPSSDLTFRADEGPFLETLDLAFRIYIYIDNLFIFRFVFQHCVATQHTTFIALYVKRGRSRCHVCFWKSSYS